MCCFLMLTALCPFLSAQSFVKIVGTDTTVNGIPIQKMRLANLKFVELEQCQEEQDSLQSRIRTYTGMTNNLRASITDLKEANRLGEAALNAKQKALDISDNQLKGSEKKVGNLRWQRNSVAGVCLALILKIAFFK